MRMASLSSGSSGNAIYIGTEETHILVDAGISNRRIEKGLKEAGLKADDLDALVVTHEHSDHVQGLNVLMRKHDVPLYATAGTLNALRKKGILDRCPEELIHVIRAGDTLSVGDLRILPFSVDHDAAEPVAYRFESGGKAAAVATDMGHFTVEANHDIRMLEAGPYPYPLKRRILGDFGHLSNESAGKLLTEILHDHVKKIILGHLSKENNLPELAFETVKWEISAGACPYKGTDFRIEVAKRDEVSALTEF